MGGRNFAKIESTGLQAAFGIPGSIGGIGTLYSYGSSNSGNQLSFL